VGDRDQIALDAAKKIMELVYGPMPVGGSVQLIAQVQVAVSEAMAAQPPAAGVDVTDEMVERACAEWWGSDWGTWTGYQADSKRAKARRILTAALRTGGGAVARVLNTEPDRHNLRPPEAQP